MSDLRTAAQQALDSINELFAAEQSEGGERGGHIRTPATREHLVRVAQARKALHESCGALRAALAQQDEPLNLRDPAVQKRLATQWGYVPAAQAEPVEPVAWECKAGGLKPLTQRQYDAQTAATKRHYTRIAPPQRKPLTAQQLDGVIERHVGGSEITDDEYASMEQFIRAVEKAVWEKNYGQA